MVPSCLKKFPTLSEQPATLSKLWTLVSGGRLGVESRDCPYSVRETQKRLALILEITAPLDPRKPGRERRHWTGRLSRPWREQAPDATFSDKRLRILLRLEVRAHPLIRPIVEEYRMIASELAAKPRKKLETQNSQEHAAAAGRRETRR